MRTAWVLQGLGFLILLSALFVLLEKKETLAPEPDVTSGNQMPMSISSITVRSPAFQHEHSIPSKYTCDGENISPPLAIDGVPENAVSLVFLMEDPDVPTHIREDGMWDHWVLFNIPPSTTRIGEGETPEGMKGVGTGGTETYTGPCPPDGQHRYYFKLFALDTALRLPMGSTKQEIVQAMEGHVIGQGELMGVYARRQ